MKKIIIAIIMCTLVFNLCFCGTTTSENGSSNQSSSTTEGQSGTDIVKPEYTGENILKDNDFSDGFNLMGTSSALQGTTILKEIRYGSGLRKPKWSLAQWWSKNDLSKGVEISTTDKYSLTDNSKSLQVDLINNSVTLEVNASKEFNEIQTKSPASWPHLLLEQAMTSPVAIKDYETVNAVLDFDIAKAVPTDGVNLHAQFAWFIYLVDKNPDSAGYGNFLWFGLNIFNGTTNFTNAYASQDTAGGLGNFIYSLASSDFLSEKISLTENNKFEFNILPYVDRALQDASKKGFMVGTTAEDISITGMNIGWEVFDMWDVAISINDIGIYVD